MIENGIERRLMRKIVEEVVITVKTINNIIINRIFYL